MNRVRKNNNRHLFRRFGVSRLSFSFVKLMRREPKVWFCNESLLAWRSVIATNLRAQIVELACETLDHRPMHTGVHTRCRRFVFGVRERVFEPRDLGLGDSVLTFIRDQGRPPRSMANSLCFAGRLVPLKE